MDRVLVFFLVVLFCAVCSYGDQIVIQSIDAEDGMMRSDENSGENDHLRIGDGESSGRTFISIISFDTTVLSGVTITAAKLVITVNENNPIWESQVNPRPDNCGPTIDLSAAFNGNTALEIPADRSASATVYNCAHRLHGG